MGAPNPSAQGSAAHTGLAGGTWKKPVFATQTLPDPWKTVGGAVEEEGAPK